MGFGFLPHLDLFHRLRHAVSVAVAIAGHVTWRNTGTKSWQSHFLWPAQMRKIITLLLYIQYRGPFDQQPG